MVENVPERGSEEIEPVYDDDDDQEVTCEVEVLVSVSVTDIITVVLIGEVVPLVEAVETVVVEVEFVGYVNEALMVEEPVEVSEDEDVEYGGTTEVTVDKDTDVEEVVCLTCRVLVEEKEPGLRCS